MMTELELCGRDETITRNVCVVLPIGLALFPGPDLIRRNA